MGIVRRCTLSWFWPGGMGQGQGWGVPCPGPGQWNRVGQDGSIGIHFTMAEDKL